MIFDWLTSERLEIWIRKQHGRWMCLHWHVSLVDELDLCILRNFLVKMAEEHKGGGVQPLTYPTLDAQNEFITTSTPNPVTRSKSRRSWFEKPTGAKLEIAIENKKRRSGGHRRKSEDEVETLLLTHFTSPPRIGFGKMKPFGLKRRHLLIKNPHDCPQDVKIEKFPFKKNFDIDQTNFTVEAEGTYLLTITWTPENEGNFREMILFQVDMSYRLQAFVFGAVEKPPQKRKMVCSVSIC